MRVSVAEGEGGAEGYCPPSFLYVRQSFYSKSNQKKKGGQREEGNRISKKTSR